MPCVEILAGPYLSGKTFYAKTKISTFDTYVRVSQRDLIRMLLPQGCKKVADLEIHEATRTALIALVSVLLSKGKNVIIDDCNLEAEELTELMEIFKMMADKVTLKLFDEPLNQIRARNTRNGQKGLTVYADSSLVKQSLDMQVLKEKVKVVNLHSFLNITDEEIEESGILIH
jgi:predicted kinase